MFTGIYGVPIGYFCNIYGKGLSYSCHRVFPAICKYYRGSLQHTQSFPLRNIGFLCDSLQPFSIDITEKTYGNPVNPCKHLQCSVADLCTYLATSTKMNVDQSLKGQNRSKCVISYPAKDIDNIQLSHLLSMYQGQVPNVVTKMFCNEIFLLS